MQYQCDKEHIFIHPAKISDLTTGIVNTDGALTRTITNQKILEYHVCPFCMSLNLKEYVEPTTEVQNVYIYDLTSGAQTKLDELLAEGYVIVNRYAKAYHLEKPKPTKESDYIEAAKKTAEISEGTLKECPK